MVQVEHMTFGLSPPAARGVYMNGLLSCTYLFVSHILYPLCRQYFRNTRILHPRQNVMSCRSRKNNNNRRVPCCPPSTSFQPSSLILSPSCGYQSPPTFQVPSQDVLHNHTSRSPPRLTRLPSHLLRPNPDRPPPPLPRQKTRIHYHLRALKSVSHYHKSQQTRPKTRTNHSQ
jgi:hypothetical protein